MKIGKRHDPGMASVKSSKLAVNNSKKIVLIIALMVMAAGLITWVYGLSVKATETISVAMTSQGIYKNQQITADMLQQYDMVKAEFEKYAINSDNGGQSRRIILWEEVPQIIGSYAAYPIPANTVVEYRSFYMSKIDNSDSVLYSFPGKEIVALEVGESDLQAFKAFLEPGDRLTITVIYKTEEEETVSDGYGGFITAKVESYRTETLFKDIIIADLLNDKGNSILDIYADYNSQPVAVQASLDASTAFQESIRPKSLLVALTPEEKEMYYYYLSMEDVSFRISLPQRIE